MELKIFSTPNSEIANYVWDIDVVDGCPVLLEEASEKEQIATVSAYLAKGSVPLMEDKGNDWSGYLLKSKTLLQLDNEVRKNINRYTEMYNFVPVYNIIDGKLVVTIGNVKINSGAM